MNEIAGSHDPTANFSESPIPDRVQAGLTIRAVHNVNDLIAESLRMRHCVAYLAEQIVGGSAVIYHAEVGGEPLTVHLQRDAACWQVVEVKGYANRAPSRRGYRAVLRWLAESLEDPT